MVKKLKRLGVGAPIAKNEYGCLECINGVGAKARYIGSGVTGDGDIDTRKFSGDRTKVIPAWKEWQAETLQYRKPTKFAKKEIAETEKEVAVMAVAKKEELKELAVLYYVTGRTIELVKAFASIDAATDYQKTLEKLMEVSGAPGEFKCDLVEVV